MSRASLILRILAHLALASLLLADGAEAGVADHAGSALSSFGRLSPTQTVQYYSLDDTDYCWYDDGWNGPGWYWCGDQWYTDYGWGGPYGWNGWGGGYAIRRHGRHGVGVWHSGAPNHVYRGAAPSQGLPSGPLGRHNFGHGPGASPGLGAGGVHAAPSLHVGGAPVTPGFVGGGSHGLAGARSPLIGPPASPGFRGGFPGFGSGGGGFHGFGGGGGFQGGFGGGGFHGFGGGGGFGGFHGGGGAFMGGHGGGGGHR